MQLTRSTLPLTAICLAGEGPGDLVGSAQRGYWVGTNEGRPPMANEAGTTLTCSNADCGCQLKIEQPCPHGDTYTCACGHPLESAATS